MDSFSVLFSGLFSLPWWGYIVLVLVLTHITIASVTIFLHRAQAHRALLLHPLVSHFFRAWLWPTTGMITKEWVAIHRKHHAKCETTDDPHSPQIYGLHRVLWAGVFLYVKASRDKAMIVHHGAGTPDDWMERNVYSEFPKLGIILLLVVQATLFGIVPGLLIWLVQMIWIPFFAAGVVNGVGHFLGYRNADTPDASHNIMPWGIIIGGEELHNNHHAFPDSAKLSSKWYEFDIGWLYIRMLEFLGLAKVKRLAPVMMQSRSFIDHDTISFLRKDKGYVRRMYRKMLLRVVRQELKGATNEDRVRFLLLRDVLERASWKSDMFLEYAAQLRAFEGTASSLPQLGRFAELLTEIQATSVVVKTTHERESSLVAELDDWIRETLHLTHPRVKKFTDILTKSYIPKLH